MALSLRSRLTAWYSILLALTVAVFCAAVLWLHWRLLVAQLDESLVSMTATAHNVVAEELGEVKNLRLAAAEMAAVVRPDDYFVEVLDASGVRVSQPPAPSERVPSGVA